MSILLKGKLNVGPIDASHGSSGKGKIADFCAATEPKLDFAISHNSQNASHVTVFDDGTEYKFNFLPSSVIRPGIKTIIGADAVISTEKALQEIKDWELNKNNLFIHPLVTIIEPEDIDFEVENLSFMGSTMTGGGAAKSRKILRLKSVFAKDHPDLKQYVTNTHELVNGWLREGKTGLCEAAQGYDLSQDTIWTGLDGKVRTMYPYNTSRNINTASYMGFSFVPPQMLGNSILNFRCYGIRVGDSTTVAGDFVVKMKDGSEVGMYFADFGVSAVPSISQIQQKFPNATHVLKLGSSGPVYDDQLELTWEEITTRSGSPIPILEQTSLTKRIRRVFDKSLLQIRNSTMACMPNIITVNFVNYLDYNISGATGEINKTELQRSYPKVYEYVEWLEQNQYWANTPYAGTVKLLGTGPQRHQMLEIVD